MSKSKAASRERQSRLSSAAAANYFERQMQWDRARKTRIAEMRESITAREAIIEAGQQERQRRVKKKAKSTEMVSKKTRNHNNDY
jgi:hypothetical protein